MGRHDAPAVPLPAPARHTSPARPSRPPVVVPAARRAPESSSDPVVASRLDLGADPLLTDPLSTDPLLTDPLLTDPLLTDPLLGPLPVSTAPPVSAAPPADTAPPAAAHGLRPDPDPGPADDRAGGRHVAPPRVRRPDRSSRRPATAAGGEPTMAGVLGLDTDTGGDTGSARPTPPVTSPTGRHLDQRVDDPDGYERHRLAADRERLDRLSRELDRSLDRARQDGGRRGSGPPSTRSDRSAEDTRWLTPDHPPRRTGREPWPAPAQRSGPGSGTRPGSADTTALLPLAAPARPGPAALPPAAADPAPPVRLPGTARPRPAGWSTAAAIPAIPSSGAGTAASTGPAVGADPVATGSHGRLLAHLARPARPTDLDAHRELHGPLPRRRFAGRTGATALVELVERAGLRGRGGAGFPTARKMATVRGAVTNRRRPVVVANGCEGDPTSGKDDLLLRTAPHLVLDGLALAAHAVGADQAILCLRRGSDLVESLEAAAAARVDDPAQVHVVTVPHRFVSSEASALVNFLTTGDARPTSSSPLPAERGVQGRPTLLDNVETLAALALLARHGAPWFRSRGTPGSPGTLLVTVGGVVRHPGVYEVDAGITLGELLRTAGGLREPAHAALLGGLGGRWITLAEAVGTPLAWGEPGGPPGALGLASLVVLPAGACGLAVTSSIVGYLAGESAGQCGPCMFGLPAVAADLAAVAAGSAHPGLLERLHRRLGVVPGRGACAHPDGAVRLAASALAVFAGDLTEHEQGRPCGGVGASALPDLGELVGDERGWR